MPTRVAAYARFSTDRQDARSLADQLRRCRRFAEERQLEVVEAFEDAAVSGASTDRDGLHRLLGAARRGAFELVLVDDLSRLSRDLGDLFRLVFDELAAAGAAVLDCQTGMRSDQAGARLTFGAVGLASDAFLQMVRHETWRGLEGRAIAGFHAGGRCYGYRTVPEDAPPDPLHPRAVPVIDLAEAAVVRRCFEAYAGGAGLREIAAGLNRDGVPAPYDRGRYGKPAGRGWGHSTVRAMLRNERYLGRWTWNRRRWIRAGARKRRLSRANPADRWVVLERPELAVVGQDLWARVQARLAEPARGRPKGGRRETYRTSPVSGLLRCGACGARMSVTGQAGRAGRVYRNLGCAAHHSKGAEVCANGMTISEGKAVAALLATVRASLAHPKFRERFEATFRKLWGLLQRGEGAGEGPSEADREEKALEAKRGRLVALLEDGAGDVEALVARVRQLEEQLRAVRDRRAAAAPPPPAVEPPSVAELAAAFDDLEGLLEGDPMAGRTALEARFTPATLTPRAGPEGLGYHLDVGLKTDPAALVAGGRKVCGVGGCGGPLDPTPQKVLVIAMGADISPARGVSTAERLLRRVDEPRLVVG